MTQQIIQSAMALNSRRIWAVEIEIDTLKAEARSWNQQGEKAFATEAWNQVRRESSKLRKLVASQKRMKVELQACYRRERIRVKFAQVFGPHHNPAQQTYTTEEQEAMLDALIAEKAAKEAEDKTAPVVYE